MGGLALLAAEQGLKVEGSDKAFYPPMSGQLDSAGVDLVRGYSAEAYRPEVGTYVVGNAVSRGNPVLEAAMEAGADYVSGPDWLCRNVLRGRQVVAVAGTHGKTTVTSMVAWILDRAGMEPGFLIGGIPPGFGVSARLGKGSPFVVEADEYDTAFFDKRPKFMHYRPTVAVLNNLEFDHADIYPDLAALRLQFSYLLRTVPPNGTAVYNCGDEALSEIVGRDFRSKALSFGRKGEFELVKADGGWKVACRGSQSKRRLPEHIRGAIYRTNALAAITASVQTGIGLEEAIAGLEDFELPKRRIQFVAELNGCPVYDDFAHHPTAIASTLEVVRELHPDRKTVVLFDPQSNTMKLGHWNDRLADAFDDATVVVHQHDGLSWDARRVLAPLGNRMRIARDHAQMGKLCRELARNGEAIVVMSNADSSCILDRLLGRDGGTASRAASGGSSG